MENFKCDDCGTTWTFKQVLPSVVKYGFVNLVGDEDELIAFNCPDESCFFMMYKRLPLKGSRSFYTKLSDELDPSGLEGGDFNYFSSQPFSKASYNILKSFEVLDYLESAWEIEKGIVAKKWGLPARCYSSCNHKNSSFFSGNVRELIYKSIDVERLFALEGKEKLRLFPRYMRENSLLKCIDNFFSEYLASESSLIEIFATSKTKGGTSAEEPPINPNTLFRVFVCSSLSLPDSIFQPDEYLEFKKRTSHHDSVIRQLNSPYKKGELHEQLTILSKEFVRDYADNFEQHRLSYDLLWDFKEGFLKKLYKAWKAGSLEKKKDENLSHQKESKIKCIALAKEIRKKNPTMIPMHVARMPSLIAACDNTYIDETRRRWICHLWKTDNLKGGRPPK